MDPFDSILNCFDNEEQIQEDFEIEEQIEQDLKNDKLYKKLYSPNLQKALDIFRYLLQNKEISERGLILSYYIINQIGNHYPAWFYRKQYFQSQQDQQVHEREIDLTKKFIKQSPKGFQSWDFLQFCFEIDPNCFKYDNIIDFLQEILNIDNRNYHCWQFRIWMTQKFDLYEKEKQYIQQEIIKDIRNNSYWNYMYFVNKCKEVKDQSQLQIFFDQAKELLKMDLNNEAAWNYLNSICDNNFLRLQYIEYCQNILKENSNNRFCLAALVFNIQKSQNLQPEQIQEIKKHLLKLQQIDQFRMNYWKWLQQQYQIQQLVFTFKISYTHMKKILESSYIF